MDLTIQTKDMFYNARVIAIIKWGEKYLFQKANNLSYRAIGGRLKFDELIEDAIKRELKEEIGFEIKEPTFVGVYENIFFDEDIARRAPFLEHTFVFYVELPEQTIFSGDIEVSQLSVEEVIEAAIYPVQMKTMILGSMPSHFFIHSSHVQLQVTKREADICFPMDKTNEAGEICEYSVRATAIIRNVEGVLVDVAGVSKNGLVLVGGRIRMAELSCDAIKREVNEELGATVLSVKFRGIAEDIFSMSQIGEQKYLHMISFMYEVTIDEQTIKTNTGECMLETYSIPKFLKTTMHLESSKSFLTNVKAVHVATRRGKLLRIDEKNNVLTLEV